MKKTLLALLLSVAMVVTYAASAIPFVLAVEGEETPTVPDDSEYGKYTGTYLNLDFDSVADLGGATGVNGDAAGITNTVEDGMLKFAASKSHTGTAQRTLTIDVEDFKVDLTKAFTVSMRLKMSANATAGFWYNTDLVTTTSETNGLGQIANDGKLCITQNGNSAIGQSLKDGNPHTIDILYTPSKATPGSFDVTVYVDGGVVAVSDAAQTNVSTLQTFGTNVSFIEFKFGNYGGDYDHETAPASMELDYFRIGDAAALYGKYAGTYLDATFDAVDTKHDGYYDYNASGKLRYPAVTPTFKDGYATMSGASETAAGFGANFHATAITIDPTQPISISYRYKVSTTAAKLPKVRYLVVGKDSAALINGNVLSSLEAGWPSFGGSAYVDQAAVPGMPDVRDGEFHTVDILYTPIEDEDETNDAKRNAQLYVDGVLIYDTTTGENARINDAVAAMTFAEADVPLNYFGAQHDSWTSESTITYDYIRLGNGTDFHICSHNLTEHPEKAPGCTETGNKLYYECTCGLLYNEATATVETTTTLEAVTIKATGHTEADDWSSNVNDHWHDCTICGKPADALTAHTDADSNNTCDICSFVLDYDYTVAIQATNISGTTVTSVTRGDKIYITVTVGINPAKEITAFSAAEVVLSFDSDYLTFDKDDPATVLNGAYVEVNGNILNLADHGTATDLTDEGKVVYKLAFTAEKDTPTDKKANVTLVDARFNTEASAKDDDLILAKFGTASVDVTVAKPNYTVTIGQNLYATTETVTEGGEFLVSLKGEYLTNYQHYDFTLKAEPADKVGAITNNGDGTFTLENVTDNVTVSIETATPKSYTLGVNFADNTENGSGTLADALLDPTAVPGTLTFGTSFTFKVAPNKASTFLDGYYYQVTVTVGGQNITINPVKDEDGNSVYTLAGTDITGDVTIDITKEIDFADYFSIGITGEDVTVKDGYDANNIPIGGSVTIVLTPKDGYKYSVSYNRGLSSDTVTFDENNEYTFNNVYSNITVTVVKTLDVVVGIEDYITLDDRVIMHLVLVTKEGGMTSAFAGSTYTYNGVDMFWSEKYSAYCCLIIDNGTAPTINDVTSRIGVNNNAAAISIDYGMDVNKSEKVDANDAQLVWNMYNARYENFTVVSMEKFLRADVSKALGVDTTDSVAIIDEVMDLSYVLGGLTPFFSYGLDSIDGDNVSSDDGKYESVFVNASTVGGYDGTALRFYRNKKGGLQLGEGMISEKLAGKSSYTVSMWIQSYPTYDEGYSFRLLSVYGKDGAEMLTMTYRNTGITVKVGSGEGNDDATLTYRYQLSSRVTGTKPEQVNDGVWHLVTLSVDLNTDSVKFYVNGDVVEPTSSTGVSFTSETFKRVWTSVVSDVLGGDAKGSEMSFNGVIDDLRLYGRALAADEIAALYDSYDEPETLCPTSDQLFIEEMLEKLGGAAVLKAETGNIVWNGYVVKADTENYDNRNKMVNGELYTPASFAERYFGAEVVANVTATDDGYYSVKALCEAAGKGYFNLTATEEKLFIVCADDTTLDPEADAKYITRAGEFCNEYDNEPTVNVEQTRAEILYSDPSTGNWVYSPSITELNGVLYASCDISNGRYTQVFRSVDGGETWESTATINKNFWWATLFTHNGELYLVGVYSTSYLGSERYIGITKSTDGITWTEMTTESGLIPYLGETDWELHRAPTPVIVYDDKLWVVFEDVGGYTNPREVLMSAPVGSDLLNPNSWTFSDPMTGHGWLFEGNPVVGPNGELYVLSRTYTEKKIVLSRLVNNTLIYLGEYDFVDGASTKFTVRYDDKTGKYLTLVNLFCGDDSIINNRTNLALVSSSDMIDWEVEEILLCDRSVMNEMVSITTHGFQYVDWIIDGEDLLFTVRESMGDAKNWHDSNYLTFYRLSNYTQYVDGQ